MTATKTVLGFFAGVFLYHLVDRIGPAWSTDALAAAALLAGAVAYDRYRKRKSAELNTHQMEG